MKINCLCQNKKCVLTFVVNLNCLVLCIDSKVFHHYLIVNYLYLCANYFLVMRMNFWGFKIIPEAYFKN